MELLTDLDPRLERLLREGPASTPFVSLPGGHLTMGSDGRPDELPVHEVAIAPFAVALAPVTNAEYAFYLDATEVEPPRFWDDERFNAPRQPVVGGCAYLRVACAPRNAASTLQVNAEKKARQSNDPCGSDSA